MTAALHAGRCQAAVNAEYAVIHAHNADCGGLARGRQPWWDHHAFAWGLEKSLYM